MYMYVYMYKCIYVYNYVYNIYVCIYLLLFIKSLILHHGTPPASFLGVITSKKPIFSGLRFGVQGYL